MSYHWNSRFAPCPDHDDQQHRFGAHSGICSCVADECELHPTVQAFSFVIVICFILLLVLSYVVR